MRCDVAGKTHSFEEVFILVYADSERDALRAARRACKANELDYRNPRNEPVKCRLARVLEAVEIIPDTLGHGTEVYWRPVSPATGERMLLVHGKRDRRRTRESRSSRQVAATTGQAVTAIKIVKDAARLAGK
jgi:hypothetical protein